MAFEKYTDEQLRRSKKILLVVAVLLLGFMAFALGYGIYQSSNDIDSNLLFLVPTVFGPLTFVPIIISTMVESELKKRSKK